MAVPPSITCVDCGGPAALLTGEPEDGWAVGDRLVYRCQDCLDRWDLLVEEDDLLPGAVEEDDLRPDAEA